MTLDEKLIIFDDEVLLSRSNVRRPIEKLKMDEIIKILTAHDTSKDILTLEKLIELVNSTKVKAFIMSRRTDGKYIENLRKCIQTKKYFLNAPKIIMCSHSIFFILKVSSI